MTVTLPAGWKYPYYDEMTGHITVAQEGDVLYFYDDRQLAAVGCGPDDRLARDITERDIAEMKNIVLSWTIEQIV